MAVYKARLIRDSERQDLDDEEERVDDEVCGTLQVVWFPEITH